MNTQQFASVVSMGRDLQSGRLRAEDIEARMADANLTEVDLGWTHADITGATKDDWTAFSVGILAMINRPNKETILSKNVVPPPPPPRPETAKQETVVAKNSCVIA
jgi:hypothetical protein